MADFDIVIEPAQRQLCGFFLGAIAQRTRQVAAATSNATVDNLKSINTYWFKLCEAQAALFRYERNRTDTDAVRGHAAPN